MSSAVRYWCLALTLLMACTNRKPPRPAFYKWQTSFLLPSSQRGFLGQIGCNNLYIKYLDVALDPASREPVPYAKLDIPDTTGISGLDIVPVVFITNEVFEQPSVAPEVLAEKVLKTVQNIHNKLSAHPLTQLQTDCDWTASTRLAYFTFLKKLRALLQKNASLSATIRLHQYKFPQQTGVPPVSRGMLMLYNTGDIDRWEEENSIFTPEAALKYLQGAPKQYPLPLDVVLPWFSWALVFREGVFWKIIPDPDPALWQDTTRFEAIETNRFMVRRGTFVAEQYLRIGDQIRVETIEEQQLVQVASVASKVHLAPDAVIAFYHLDADSLSVRTVFEVLQGFKL
jgi:hypothetical protein